MQQNESSSDSEWEVVNNKPVSCNGNTVKNDTLENCIVLTSIPLQTTAHDSALDVRVQPHVSVLPAEQTSSLHGMISLRVPSIGDTTRLTQLDIVAIVDRSGSMSGQRIEMVKRACKFMVRQMRPSDRFSLVSYSNNATVDLSLTLLDENGRELCAKAIEALSPSGQTNLGEGLLWGLGELASSEAPAAAVLLFTDGLANIGLTSTDSLLEAMEGPMSDMGRKSRAVFTFGFGQDHNAQMLFALADAGTGCYYYVETLQAIAPAFADCLGGMLSVCAQDVILILRTANGAIINEVHADFSAEIKNGGAEVHIRMRDLCAGTEKDVIFKLTVPAISKPNVAWLAVQCDTSYVDAANGVAEIVHSVMLLERTSSSGHQGADLNSDVELHRCRILVARAMEDAAVSCAKQSAAEVKSSLSQALEVVDKSLAGELRKDIEQRMQLLKADLHQCLEHALDLRTCEKWCSTRSFAHKHQISTSAEGTTYRNDLQMRLADAARRELGLFSTEVFAPKPRRPRRHCGRPEAHSARKTVECSSPWASNSNAGEILAGCVRTGMRIICKGRPAVVKDTAHSKTGKHGHAKVFLTALTDDGLTLQDIMQTSASVVLASVQNAPTF